MIVTKQILDDFKLKIPEELKNISSRDFFVFYYVLDEQNLCLKIFEYEVLREVNLSLYRGLNDKSRKYKESLKIGYFSESMDTKDGLFFQFLKTYNPKELVYEFYNSIIEQEKIVDLNVSINATTEIYNSDDFKRAISYFSPSRMQTIMFVYDLVNQAFRIKLGKSLYGNTIKKIVNLVKFEGGVLPEWENSSLRYMIIGEHANLTEIQKEKLEEAKKLIRSDIAIDKIYAKTGWALGDKDGKWRTNIADDEAAISMEYMVEYGGKRLYVPNGWTPENVLPLTLNPNNLYPQRYPGKLYEVLKHPTLFRYYPRLANVPIVYFFQDALVNNKNIISRPQEYYFSENSRGGLILMNGSYLSGDSLSIMLHEIQHSIQNFEGFARGGNLFLAQFVASVGSESVRKIFASINRMQHYFRDYLYNEESRTELKIILEDSFFSSKSSNGLRNSILELLLNQETYEDNFKNINFYLVFLISEENDFTSNLFSFIHRKIGDLVYDLFEVISSGYQQAKNYEELLVSTEGFSREKGDIDRILFKGYENLYGEMESRSVQSSRFLQSEYKNYFHLTHWEIEPLSNLTVIDGIEKIVDVSKVVGACEKLDDNYILHFQQERSCVPFIHELGHIVYDAMIRLGYEEMILKEFDKELAYKDADEFFVSKFVGYFKDKINNEIILEDTRMDFSLMANKNISKMLDEFFNDNTMDIRIQYLNKILSLIEDAE